MKTAYELAMERLNKSSPMTKLTEEQKNELAELDSKYAAKIAEREISLQGELDQASARGDLATQEQLEQRLVNERKALAAELEEKKDKVRQRGR
jgi:hypothetical protein